MRWALNGMLRQLIENSLNALSRVPSSHKEAIRQRIDFLKTAESIEPERVRDHLRGFKVKVVPRSFESATSEVAEAFDLASWRMINGEEYRLTLRGEILSVPSSFHEHLERAKCVSIEIDSMGGCGNAGFEMAKALRDSKKPVHATIKLAMSAAAVVAMGATERVIAEDGLIVLHTGACLTIGDAAQLRRIAELLDQHESEMVEFFSVATGRPVEQCAEWFKPGQDACFTAEAALDAGLAHRIL